MPAFALDWQRADDLVRAGRGAVPDWRAIIDVLADPVFVAHVRHPPRTAREMILKSETYHFHRLDLTRQAGFIVTIYDEDGLRLTSAPPLATPSQAFAEARKIVDN